MIEILREIPTKNPGPDAYDEVRPPANNNNPCISAVLLFPFSLPHRDDWTASKVLSFLGQEDKIVLRICGK